MHALQDNGWVSAFASWIGGLDNSAQRGSRDVVVHGLQEGVTFGGPSMLLESGALIDYHGKGGLLHLAETLEPHGRWTFFSLVLG